MSETVRLIDLAWREADPLAPLWTLAVYTGARKGELLGLTWEDVDLDIGTMAIRRRLAGIDGTRPLFGEPKSESSRHSLAIPAAAVLALRRQHARQSEDRVAVGRDNYADFGLIFATRLGTPLGERGVSKDFKTALERAGLPQEIRFHDLRHFHGTAMAATGVHPKVASSRLGHSTIAITMDLYTHSVDEADRDAAGRIEEALDRVRRTS